jgi:large subunit ribosomal protein L25
MSDQFELIARVRARSGSNLVRRLRREGDVPAVLYGGGKDSIHIAINHDVLFHSLEKEEFHSTIIIINTDGKKEQAILRDVQRHPHKINILHADFQRIDDTKILTMSLPIHFMGEEECIGVKTGGGIISHLMNDVEITCLPKDLPESIELDISNLDLNESMHLSDIYLPEGVNITTLMHDENNEHDYAVVSVLPPRIEIEPEDEEDAQAVESDDQAAEDTEPSDSSDEQQDG